MGIDRHGRKFLGYCASKQPFGRVATIGRQGLIEPSLYVEFGSFCEPALKALWGATAVDSFDCSDYEGATHIADFNHPLQVATEYDTVIDGGTTEHVFDVAQALRNVSHLCREGGQIIHIVPANNFCGHGFWQFSPEVFLSLYSPENGYQNTQILLASLHDHARWFEVTPPKNGNRAEVISRHPVYIFCRTVKSEAVALQVQQSDYVHHWAQEKPARRYTGKVAAMLRRHHTAYVMALTVYNFAAGVWRNRSKRLDQRNPHLKIITETDLINPTA